MADAGTNPERRTRILLVDDFEDGRSALRLLLQHAGFEVAEAATGAEGLLRAAESPDLIILDVRLPDIDGFEVCHRLKSTPTTATVPVLHLTAAYLRSQDRVRGLESGADAYLTQPVADEELLATINVLIRTHRAEAALRESEARYREAQREMAALRAVASLAATAGHAISNPLAVIQGHLETLVAPGAAPPDVSYRVGRVLRAVNEIRDIVRRMSTVTKLEPGDPSPDRPARLEARKPSGDRA